MIETRSEPRRSFSKLSTGSACALLVLVPLLALGARFYSSRGIFEANSTSSPATRGDGRKGSGGRERAEGRERAKGFSANSLTDTDGDGLPDAAELHSFTDRESFRSWFTVIAETQFYELSEEWNTGQRDCAGLVRFSWREALRPHDRAWFQKMGAGYEAIAPDVSAYKLGDAPLGEKIFRTRSGSFKETTLDDGNFSDFADARTLKEFNCVFVGRDRRLARPGDLLFFYQPRARAFPYHVMIFIGEARAGDAEGANDWVVYHTGATPEDAGVMKKVRLATLDHHPQERWRPVELNRNFLGFYRLKILD